MIDFVFSVSLSFFLFLNKSIMYSLLNIAVHVLNPAKIDDFYVKGCIREFVHLRIFIMYEKVIDRFQMICLYDAFTGFV